MEKLPTTKPQETKNERSLSNSSARKNGVFSLTEPITAKTFNDFVDYFYEVNYNSKFQQLVINISSNGGLCSAGFGIIDLIRTAAKPVTTVAFGDVASMAAMIFINGTTRVMGTNSRLMFHQYSAGTYGQDDNLKNDLKRQEQLRASMVNNIVLNTGLTVPEVLSKIYTPKDIWLTQEEAVQLNLVDESLRCSIKRRHARFPEGYSLRTFDL